MKKNIQTNKLIGICECCGLEIYDCDEHAIIDGNYYCDYCGGENGIANSEMSKYQKGKERARQKAIDWQLDFCNHNYSYSELADFGDYFYKLGKRYGLLKEFRENGIC